MSRALVARVLLEAGWAVSTILASVWVARATPGETATDRLAFSGTLLGNTGQPLQGAQRIGFAFKTSAGACSPVTSNVTPDPRTGAIHVGIPLGTCEKSLFHGSDTSIDVSVNGSVLARDQPIAPVPYAKLADRVGAPDCPLGYAKQPAASGKSFTICARGKDVLVKVGVGQAAFWIDRYEASIFSERFGAGSQVIPANEEYPSDFPRNGQHTADYYAASVEGVLPNRSLTWFQAAAACRASGKRLPHSDEWLAAARGTPDPSAESDGSGGTCSTRADDVREAGLGTDCVSAWGAEDMVGNLAEWTSEWLAGMYTEAGASQWKTWPAEYGSDAVSGVVSSARTREQIVTGLPSASLRGGNYGRGILAGVFALSLDEAPSYFHWINGFRCVVER